MNSIDFKAERHKLIAHRAVHKLPAAEQPRAKPHKPDLLDRLIDRHPLLHHIELLLPCNTAPPLLPLLPQPSSYHISARLTSFLSSSFLLSLLSSGTLAAFTLCTPIDRCNSFTLLSSSAANHSSTPAASATAATLTLTLDDDTYQQVGLTGQSLVAQPGFHIVTVPIQPSSWLPTSRFYQRVHTCLAAMAEVDLLVQHVSDDGHDGLEAQLGSAEGIRLIKRVDNTEQRWHTEQQLAVPDVSAVWQAACEHSDESAMLRQQRKDAQQQVDQLDVELVDWLGLAANRFIHLLPTHTIDTLHLASTSSAPSLVDNAFCTSLPLLPAATADSLASVRYTGLLSHGHMWRSLLSHGRSLLSSESASVPWVCLTASNMVDAGNVEGVDGSGNAENDWCVLLLRDGRYLLYQLANACVPVH